MGNQLRDRIYEIPYRFASMSVGFQAYSQSQLNEYKYIIVPKKFDGFKNENQYQTSTAIKYYFVQQGFNAVYEDALPQDLNMIVAWDF